jgi:hypothetical protein
VQAANVSGEPAKRIVLSVRPNRDPRDPPAAASGIGCFIGPPEELVNSRLGQRGEREGLCAAGWDPAEVQIPRGHVAEKRTGGGGGVLVGRTGEAAYRGGPATEALSGSGLKGPGCCRTARTRFPRPRAF